MVAAAIFALLVLAVPFWFLGHQVGLWALGAGLVYFLVTIGFKASSRTLLALIVPIGEIPPGRSRQSVWDALGSIAQDGAVLLLQSSLEIPERRPDCRLYRKISPVMAFAPQGRGLTGHISWNAHAMTKERDVRHLLRYLRSKGDPAAAETLRPWLEQFLFLLTHETVHLLERTGSTTHEEEFYRHQRRLLEKGASAGRTTSMTLCEREARRTVRWAWSPAWFFLMRRSAKRRRWERAQGAQIFSRPRKQAPILPASTVGSLPLQQVPRDHQPLHLAGALVDRGDAHVAVEAGDLVVVVEAVAAVDLQALPAGAVGGLAGVELGLGGEAAGLRRRAPSAAAS